MGGCSHLLLLTRADTTAHSNSYKHNTHTVHTMLAHNARRVHTTNNAGNPHRQLKQPPQTALHAAAITAATVPMTTLISLYDTLDRQLEQCTN